VAISVGLVKQDRLESSEAGEAEAIYTESHASNQ
jgi:hypothetical protein